MHLTINTHKKRNLENSVLLYEGGRKMKRRIYLFLASCVVLMVLVVLLSSGFNRTPKSTTDTKATMNTNSNLAFNVEVQPLYEVITPSSLYNKADLVFTGKYVKDNKAFVAQDTIKTEATFHVNKILKGSISKQELKDSVNIQYYGGEMLLGDYLDQLDKQDARNLDLIKSYTENDRKTKKVTTTTEKQANKTKNKNTEYLIFVSYDSSTNTYHVLGDEFAMRKIDDKGNIFNPATNQFEKVDFYPAK